MVKYNPRLDAIFQALSDPTRRAMLDVLAQRQASVGELAASAPHSMSLPAVMKHLRVLESAGLVSHRKTGRLRRCRLAARPLEQAATWLSRYEIFWNKQFDSLERFLAQEQVPAKEKQQWPKPKSRRIRRSR